MPAVRPSHLPAPLPIPAMAGVISAKMRTGMKRSRKLLNSPLKVTNTRASQSGKKRLQTMPRMIATMIRNSSIPDSFLSVMGGPYDVESA